MFWSSLLSIFFWTSHYFYFFCFLVNFRIITYKPWYSQNYTSLLSYLSLSFFISLIINIHFYSILNRFLIYIGFSIFFSLNSYFHTNFKFITNFVALLFKDLSTITSYVLIISILIFTITSLNMFLLFRL